MCKRKKKKKKKNKLSEGRKTKRGMKRQTAADEIHNLDPMPLSVPRLENTLLFIVKIFFCETILESDENARLSFYTFLILQFHPSLCITAPPSSFPFFPTHVYRYFSIFFLLPYVFLLVSFRRRTYSSLDDVSS